MNETAKITSPQKSVIHSTFSIERDLPACSSARLFRARRPGYEAPLVR
jgi:hypothetical protein